MPTRPAGAGGLMVGVRFGPVRRRESISKDGDGPVACFLRTADSGPQRPGTPCPRPCAGTGRSEPGDLPADYAVIGYGAGAGVTAMHGQPAAGQRFFSGACRRVETRAGPGILSRG